MSQPPTTSGASFASSGSSTSVRPPPTLRSPWPRVAVPISRAATRADSGQSPPPRDCGHDPPLGAPTSPTRPHLMAAASPAYESAVLSTPATIAPVPRTTTAAFVGEPGTLDFVCTGPYGQIFRPDDFGIDRSSTSSSHRSFPSASLRWPSNTCSPSPSASPRSPTIAATTVAMSLARTDLILARVIASQQDCAKQMEKTAAAVRTMCANLGIRDVAEGDASDNKGFHESFGQHGLLRDGSFMSRDNWKGILGAKPTGLVNTRLHSRDAGQRENEASSASVLPDIFNSSNQSQNLFAVMSNSKKDETAKKEPEKAIAKLEEQMNADKSRKGLYISKLERQITWSEPKYMEEIQNMQVEATEKDEELTAKMHEHANLLREKNEWKQQLLEVRKEQDGTYHTIANQEEQASVREIKWDAYKKYSEDQLEAEQQQVSAFKQQLQEAEIHYKHKEEQVSLREADQKNSMDEQKTQLQYACLVNVEISSGLHWYLKHYCTGQISWDKTGGAQLYSVPHPGSLPRVQLGGVLNRKLVEWSYYQNAVTSSYPFAWWDWARWKKEIDWMTLQGINLPHTFSGQEAIWQKVFQRNQWDPGIRCLLSGMPDLKYSRQEVPLTSSDGFQKFDAHTDMAGKEWKKVEFDLPSSKTNSNFKLQLTTSKGGDYVMGSYLLTAFRWSDIVGPWEERPGHFNDAWDYWTDDGLGLFEFLQLAQDFGACPVGINVLPPNPNTEAVRVGSQGFVLGYHVQWDPGIIGSQGPVIQLLGDKQFLMEAVM